MKYNFWITHGATTKSEAKMDSVLKNKIRVWKTYKVQQINHHTMPVVFG